MARGPLTGQIMIFMSVTYGGGAFLARECVVLKPIESECANQRMVLVLRDRVAHGLPAHRRRFEPPRAPSGIKIEAADRRAAHDRREVRRHVRHARPLAY